MKQYTTLILLFALSILLFSCGTSQSAGKTSKSKDYSTMANLSDALRVQSGVQVTGSGDNVKVTIRGINTAQSKNGTSFYDSPSGGAAEARETKSIADVEPLFVVDGTIVGNSYAAASSTVNVQDIKSIKILKSYAELNAYGEQGKNGAILISTYRK